MCLVLKIHESFKFYGSFIILMKNFNRQVVDSNCKLISKIINNFLQQSHCQCQVNRQHIKNYGQSRMNLTQQVSPFLTLLHALLRNIKPYCSTAKACYLVLLLLLYVYWNSPEYSPVCPRYQKSNIPISIRIARTSRSISTES